LNDEEEESSQGTQSTSQTSTPVVEKKGGIDLMDSLFGGEKPSSSTTSSNTAPKSPLDLLGLGGPTTSSPTPSTKSSSPLDLLSDLGGPSMSTPVHTQPSSSPLDLLGFGNPSPPSSDVVGFDQNGIRATYKKDTNGNITTLEIDFSNSTSNTFSNFDFKVAVPKYIKLQVTPPTSTTLNPNANKGIHQTVKLLNTETDKPLMMKIKIDYLQNGQPSSATGDFRI